MVSGRLVRIAGRGRARGFPRAVPARPVRAAIALLIMVAHLSACFRHAPADFATIGPGAELQVTIGDRGRTELRDVLGPGAERVDGRLVDHTDDEILLAVTTVRHVDLREPVRWAGESVAIPRQLVSGVQERTLDRTRSWVVGGLILVGAVLVSMISIRGLGSDSGNDGPPSNGNGET